MIKVSGTGCALVDYLYKPVNFSSATFNKYMSKASGDGGLSPGKLVFKDEFDKFSGEDYRSVRNSLTQGMPPVALNIGGPSIVSLIHAAQMLEGLPAEVRFYGKKGDDEGAAFIDENLKRTPLKIAKYGVSGKYTPFTEVLSDPDYEGGHGERIFINNIGAAWDMRPEDLDESFFESDIVAFGGTALVPEIHKALLGLLEKAKGKNAVTVVNTVYDYLSEKNNPKEAWPLGESAETYKYVDLLVADMEEALRLSGKADIGAAMSFFKDAGVGALIVTYGVRPLYYFSNSPLFGVTEGTMPVSNKVDEEKKAHPERIGDTTGCGDNFAGGVVASLVNQMIESGKGRIDFEKAIAWGAVSGGYACFYHGGTFYEEYAGQKRELLTPYYQDYLVQTGNLKK